MQLVLIEEKIRGGNLNILANGIVAGEAEPCFPLFLDVLIIPRLNCFFDWQNLSLTVVIVIVIVNQL